jgi:uncharacterized membrane protein
MNTPRTIAEYLEQLRAALKGADPALIQDALYDAEEHLRAEMADRRDRSEAEMLAHVVGSYGAPEEVADIYRDQEIKIQRALRTPPPPKRRSPIGRFFGVAADPRAWGALFYMLLAMVTGIFYFTWVVTGVALSAGLSVLIIGVPFVVLFFGTVRALSLVEGRIVEGMLGVRMPRRPPYPQAGLPLLQRIGAMFTDPRTWGTLFYMVLMLPLGIFYFTVAVTSLSVSLGLIGAPIVKWLTDSGVIDWGQCNGPFWICDSGNWGVVALMFIAGVVLLFATLHLARALGHLHGVIAKHLLVSRAALA